MDKMAFQQGKIIPTPFSAPPAGAMVPPPPILLGPPHAGMMPVGRAPGMRPPMRGHLPMTPRPPMMDPPAHPMMVPTWPGMTPLDS